MTTQHFYAGITYLSGEIQVKLMSWWPRPAAWNTSGLETGYWSRDAELWYQSHLKSIREATDPIFLPHNSQWRQRLRFGLKNAVQLKAQNDRLSAEYLLVNFKIVRRVGSSSKADNAT